MAAGSRVTFQGGDLDAMVCDYLSSRGYAAAATALANDATFRDRTRNVDRVRRVRGEKGGFGVYSQSMP